MHDPLEVKFRYIALWNTKNIKSAPVRVILTKTPRPFITRPLLVIPLILLRCRLSCSLGFRSTFERLFIEVWRSPLYKKRFGGTSGISSGFIFVTVTRGCSSPSSGTSPSSASESTCPALPALLFLLQVKYKKLYDSIPVTTRINI